MAKVTKAELTRKRNRNVKRLRKAGWTDTMPHGGIKSYLKGWSIPDSQRQKDSDK